MILIWVVTKISNLVENPRLVIWIRITFKEVFSWPHSRQKSTIWILVSRFQKMSIRLTKLDALPSRDTSQSKISWEEELKLKHQEWLLLVRLPIKLMVAFSLNQIKWEERTISNSMASMDLLGNLTPISQSRIKLPWIKILEVEMTEKVWNRCKLLSKMASDLLQRNILTRKKIMNNRWRSHHKLEDLLSRESYSSSMRLNSSSMEDQLLEEAPESILQTLTPPIEIFHQPSSNSTPSQLKELRLA